MLCCDWLFYGGAHALIRCLHSPFVPARDRVPSARQAQCIFCRGCIYGAVIAFLGAVVPVACRRLMCVSVVGQCVYTTLRPSSPLHGMRRAVSLRWAEHDSFSTGSSAVVFVVVRSGGAYSTYRLTQISRFLALVFCVFYPVDPAQRRVSLSAAPSTTLKPRVARALSGMRCSRARLDYHWKWYKL